VDDLSEKEQIEQMRAWWSEYGNYVVGGIVVGIVLIVGFSQYRSNARTQQTEASTLYETLFEAVADGKSSDAEAVAADLYENYASTVYPSQAKLAMARMYMDKGRDQDAADALREIVDQEPDSELGLIARLRLAKVLQYQDKAQDVVELLSGRTESAFAARYGEALGDAYMSLGMHDDAREAYLLAIADSAALPTVDRALLQMKVDDLPEVAIEQAVDAGAGDTTADLSSANTESGEAGEAESGEAE